MGASLAQGTLVYWQKKKVKSCTLTDNVLCYLHYSSSERVGVERLILTVYAQCKICPPSTFEEPWGSCYPECLQLHHRYLLLHSDR